MEIIPRDDDGYHHPRSETELQALVQYAYENGVALRVRGSQHSVVPSIYTNGYDGEGKPPGNSIDVMLNLYRSVVITPDPKDPSHADVEVEAGCNLGKNPYDPTHTSTWENSLDFKLQAAGYALEDTGGITHQTISGFMSTGSSGGSLTYAFETNLVGFSIIDGTGKIWTLRRDDPSQEVRDMFYAAGVSMGLLGVISKVWLRVGPDFNIYGTQVTSKTSEAGIDFYGGGDATPSLTEFFRRTPYTRLMWWPQHNLDRMSVWQAARTPPAKDFVPQPYLEMGADPQPESLAGSFFYTLIGNLGDVSVVPARLQNWYKHLLAWLAGDPDPNACVLLPAGLQRKAPSIDDILQVLKGPIENGLRDFATAQPQAFQAALDKVKGLVGPSDPFPKAGPDLPQWAALLITIAVALIFKGALDTPLAQAIADLLSAAMPWLITYILAIFVTLGPQYFWESWRCGLPMDNQMDDQLWDTEFTELWIPLDKTQEVMNALNTFYQAGGDVAKAYQATGSFSCEIYAAGESKFWMSPSYGTPVIRIDVFWFGLNAGSPATAFYPQFWSLLKPFAYRPHWGKYLGPPENYLGNIPRLKDFVALRAKLDPKGIFLTDYWKAALGLR